MQLEFSQLANYEKQNKAPPPPSSFLLDRKVSVHPFHFYRSHRVETKKIITACGKVQFLSANTAASWFAKLPAPTFQLKQSQLHFYRLIQVKRKKIKIANGDWEMGAGTSLDSYTTQGRVLFCSAETIWENTGDFMACI